MDEEVSKIVELSVKPRLSMALPTQGHMQSKSVVTEGLEACKGSRLTSRKARLLQANWSFDCSSKQGADQPRQQA